MARSATRWTKSGQPDYEHLEAVDLKLFNADLDRLVRGAKDSKPPRFDFTTKRREYRGESLALAPDQVVIVEGIHGLNPRLTHMVPAGAQVPHLRQRAHPAQPWTPQPHLDHRQPADAPHGARPRYRGHSALTPCACGRRVRRGEKRWIFPFQREADATFNSALDYELAVLKPLVEPLLMQVKPSRRRVCRGAPALRVPAELPRPDRPLRAAHLHPARVHRRQRTGLLTQLSQPHALADAGSVFLLVAEHLLHKLDRVGRWLAGQNLLQGRLAGQFLDLDCEPVGVGNRRGRLSGRFQRRRNPGVRGAQPVEIVAENLPGKAPK